jgi:intracellular multiplication protein IcmM
MRQQSLREKKGRKGFYVKGFRVSVSALLVSLVLNLMLSSGIYNRLIRIPEYKFYATDGIAAPILLTPLEAPNKSAKPLLEDDPPEEMITRDLPENI